ncbi:hypothetical protein RHO12_00650 [Orbus sturtevantii]|uniref:hypothetical protein n=1 Tax=Orbus sturtevantii TaxID=3074109 RepID=UPI00370DE13E
MVVNRAKISWSCRRDKKALAAYLFAFFEKVYHLLNVLQQFHFSLLLMLDDLTLFECFFKQRIGYHTCQH